MKAIPTLLILALVGALWFAPSKSQQTPLVAAPQVAVLDLAELAKRSPLCDCDDCKCAPPCLCNTVDDSKAIPLTNQQIVETFAKHEKEISKIWLALGEDATLKDAVLKWRDQKPLTVGQPPDLVSLAQGGAVVQEVQFTQPVPQVYPTVPEPKPQVCPTLPKAAAVTGDALQNLQIRELQDAIDDTGKYYKFTRTPAQSAPATPKPVPMKQAPVIYQAPANYGSCGPGGCGVQRRGLFGRRR